MVEEHFSNLFTIPKFLKIQRYFNMRKANPIDVEIVPFYLKIWAWKIFEECWDGEGMSLIFGGLGAFGDTTQAKVWISIPITPKVSCLNLLPVGLLCQTNKVHNLTSEESQVLKYALRIKVSWLRKQRWSISQTKQHYLSKAYILLSGKETYRKLLSDLTVGYIKYNKL